MDPRQSVLIVDPSEETREVLRSALERRGLSILSASRSSEGLELARRHQPDLIVVDLDETKPATVTVASDQADWADQTAPMVFLGSARRRSASSGEFVAKPYHYAPLIRRIEALLAASTNPAS